MIKTVFLDRDDTICRSVPYCSKPQDLVLFEGAGTAISRLKENGFLLLLITNQSGISRGYFTHDDLSAIHQKMQNDLSESGAIIDDIFYCPCHPTEGCKDRKPEFGLFTKASKKYDIDINKSYMVGDKKIDIIAGKRFGVTTILVSNKEESGDEDYFAEDITQAADWIIKNEK